MKSWSPVTRKLTSINSEKKRLKLRGRRGVLGRQVDGEFGTEDHISILATVIGREPEPLDVRTDPGIRLNQ
jgi:hypothetical protein